MNILVMASAIKMGGAKEIYNQFISHLPQHVGNNKYLIFVSSQLETPKIVNVDYVICHWDGHMKRLAYEEKYLDDVLKKKEFKPDIVISLQNNGYKNISDCKQIVYYHQALPLYSGWYNPLKRSERRLFYYHSIFPYEMQHTWAKETVFAVQTPVVKKRFIERFNKSAENVHVFFPDVENINVENLLAKEWEDNKYHFLFVGDGYKYRNLKTAIKAIASLYVTNPDIAPKIAVHITKTADSEPGIVKLINKFKVSDNFFFECRMPHKELLSFYKSLQALLSPSVVETVGLPMIEAASLGIPVLTSDMDFSRFVLGNYNGASFIEPYNVSEWAKAIVGCCSEHRMYRPLEKLRKSDWDAFFNLYSNK